MKKILLSVCILVISNNVFSQNEEEKENSFSIGVQQRSRAEIRDGAFTPLSKDDDIAALVNNRSRISMEYKREKLIMAISAQHFGVWGQDSPSEPNGRATFNEAWTQFFPAKNLFLKVGRQTLVYDDERLLGASDWNVSGRYHDVFKIGFENERNKAHATFAFNQNGNKLNASSGTFFEPGGQPYKTMQTAWYNLIPNEVFNISFIAINLGYQTGSLKDDNAAVKYIQTAGTNISVKPNDFQLYGTFYWQTGNRIVNNVNKDINAFFGAVKFSYSINEVMKVNCGLDYLSGDEGNKDAKTYKAFDLLYGTQHRYFGAMDYFTTQNNSCGILDNYYGFSYKISPKFNFSVDYHMFQSTTDLKNNKDETERYLGSEIDLLLSWNFMKDITLTGGYSTMLPSETLKILRNTPNARDYQQWFWISLNINPKVLISKW